MRALSIALLLSWAAMFPASAEQVFEFGDYRVHWATMNSIDLQPEIARGYGIRRSRNRGLVVLSPMRVQGGSERAVSSVASGTVHNLIGHRQELEFRAIDEGQAFYLVAEYRISHHEFLHFTLELMPEGADTALPMRFSRQFFVD